MTGLPWGAHYLALEDVNQAICRAPRRHRQAGGVDSAVQQALAGAGMIQSQLAELNCQDFRLGLEEDGGMFSAINANPEQVATARLWADVPIPGQDPPLTRLYSFFPQRNVGSSTRLAMLKRYDEHDLSKNADEIPHGSSPVGDIKFQAGQVLQTSLWSSSHNFR